MNIGLPPTTVARMQWEAGLPAHVVRRTLGIGQTTPEPTPEPRRSAVPMVLAVGVLGVAFYIFFATLNIKK